MAAIYQWFDGLIETQIWTTTPYPIEVIEKVKFSISLSAGVLRPITKEELSLTVIPLSGTLVTLLLSGNGPDEELSLNSIPLSGVLNTILLEYTGPEEELNLETIPLSGTLESKLVTALTPDEGAEFSITLGTCSLDPV